MGVCCDLHTGDTRLLIAVATISEGSAAKRHRASKFTYIPRFTTTSGWKHATVGDGLYRNKMASDKPQAYLRQVSQLRLQLFSDYGPEVTKPSNSAAP